MLRCGGCPQLPLARGKSKRSTGMHCFPVEMKPFKRTVPCLVALGSERLQKSTQNFPNSPASSSQSPLICQANSKITPSSLSQHQIHSALGGYPHHELLNTSPEKARCCCQTWLCKIGAFAHGVLRCVCVYGTDKYGVFVSSFLFSFFLITSVYYGLFYGFKLEKTGFFLPEPSCFRKKAEKNRFFASDPLFSRFW